MLLKIPISHHYLFWPTPQLIAFPQCNMQEGMEGNPAGATMKKVMRVFALITVPITMSFPKVLK